MLQQSFKPRIGTTIYTRNATAHSLLAATFPKRLSRTGPPPQRRFRYQICKFKVLGPNYQVLATIFQHSRNKRGGLGLSTELLPESP